MYGSMREVSRQAPRQVGLGVVLRRNEADSVYVKEVIAGFAAQRQGGLQVLACASHRFRLTWRPYRQCQIQLMAYRIVNR